jgi:PKD repeat protein
MKRALLAAALFLVLAMLLSGCALDNILNNMVNREPRAVIDAKPTQGTAPLVVTLDAHYSHDDDGSLIETRWDLGDPADTGSKLDSAITHEFKTPGTYIVKLTVTDNEGAMNSQQLAIIVTNPPPVASATVNDAAPHPGDEVQFDATGSTDAFGEVTGYLWDFGDSETASTAKATHAYKNGGTYVVTLTVTDDGGLTSQSTLTMNVKPGTSNCTPGGGGTCGGSDVRPLAVITIPYGYTSCSGGTAGVPLTFDGTASRAVTGKIELYQWDFGDGGTASGAVVQHTYSTPWRYTVKLTVTDSGGAVGSAQGVCSIGGSSCTSQ